MPSSIQSLSAAPEPVPGLEDDTEGSSIVREELRLLAMVLQALNASGTVNTSAALGRALDDERLLQLRDDVAVAKPEDLPALFEQMHHLGALRERRGRSIVGSVDRASPYFGHMRLEEPLTRNERAPGAAATRRRDVLIGSRWYVDSAAGIRIVDWRHAPVSRIYYRYAEGDDYEEELGGRLIEGRVAVRRSVSVAVGELVRVAAPQGTFVRERDGRWRRVAARRARLESERRWAAQIGVATQACLGADTDGQLRQDKHLPAIAALLDSKQFELIAREEGLIAVQGSAGSGKTTVGMHRIAYLAFRNPHRFRAARMLMVVPNEALGHYVSRVLPSLGVKGVPVTTFQRFATRLVANLFPKLPTAIHDGTPPVVSRVKSHPAMLRGITRIVTDIDRELDARTQEAVSKWPEGSKVLAAWQATRLPETAVDFPPVRTPPDVRLAMLSDWVTGRRQFAGVEPSLTLPEVTRHALEQLVARQRAVTRSASAVWDELLTSRESLAQMFCEEPGYGPPVLDQVHTWCVRQARVRVEGEREGDSPTLDAEDRALLLRCWQSVRGSLVDSSGKPIHFAHLFVDEVQDVSPVELRVLLDLGGKQRCITLAGDVAQRMMNEDDVRGEFDWDALLDALGLEHSKIEPLRVSYRSTAEITAFAREILGPLAHDDAPDSTRHGPPVELFQFASAGEAVDWLAGVLRQLARDEPDANVALIARFPQQADVYFDGLSRAELPNVRRVAQQDFSWEPGVDVTDVRQTKGLEFDEVVLLETTATTYPVTAPGRHALYLGATRASHQLWCLASEPPSELVTGAIGVKST